MINTISYDWLKAIKILYPNRKRYHIIYISLLIVVLLVVPSIPVISQPIHSRVIHARQGEVLFLRLELPDEAASTRIQFQGKEVPLFKLSSPGVYGTLVGVDLGSEPSRYSLKIDGVPDSWNYVIEVVSVNFGVQELTLPDDQVELDRKTLKRVQKEQQEILRSMDPVRQRKLWEGEFIMPVDGTNTGRFGVKRIINGQPRSPHSGEDFAASQGTPVQASNTGEVVLIGDYFFSGKSVILDHGLGVFTMYFHMESITVKTGDFIKKGAVMGTVGATGRASGPHLHWGVRILGKRVNPLSLFNMRVATVLLTEP